MSDPYIAAPVVSFGATQLNRIARVGKSKPRGPKPLLQNFPTKRLSDYVAETSPFKPQNARKTRTLEPREDGRTALVHPANGGKSFVVALPCEHWAHDNACRYLCATFKAAHGE